MNKYLKVQKDQLESLSVLEVLFKNNKDVLNKNLTNIELKHIFIKKMIYWFDFNGEYENGEKIVNLDDVFLVCNKEIIYEDREKDFKKFNLEFILVKSSDLENKHYIIVDEFHPSALDDFFVPYVRKNIKKIKLF
jgi:hypothetical protein